MNNILTKTFILFACLVIGCIGCDIFNKEKIPEELPPVPETCIALSNEYINALNIAYTSVKASQLQISTIANKFAQCMQDEGLSRAEAKGIINDIEKQVRNDIDKSKDQNIYIY